MSDNKNNQQDMSLEEKSFANYGAGNSTAPSANAERLKEVNKKLPSWSLEPPFDFI